MTCIVVSFSEKRCLLPNIENGYWVDSFVEIENRIRYMCNNGFEDRTQTPVVRGLVAGVVDCFLNETISYEPHCTGKCPGPLELSWAVSTVRPVCVCVFLYNLM